MVDLEIPQTPGARTSPRTPRAPWLSPEDQPPWARPALLAIAVLAGAVYLWGIGQMGVHEYYAPAVRSMSDSWKVWVYGGYDPRASITLDKLPGSFMVQALFVRVLGFHAWSMILPQVIAAVASVLVLYRMVRRWQGPVAGLLAAGLLASTPIVAAVARSQVSDGILMLLLVLAADAVQRAMSTGRSRPLLLCAVLVGFAFQTKMVQAWAVLPVFGIVYLVAAPLRLRVRLGRLGVAGLVTLAVSLWQVALFALTPVSSRPYADGTRNNSLLTTIFEYNLSTRFGSGGGSSVGSPGLSDPPNSGGGGFAGYLLSSPVAPQIGWLFPLVVFGLVLGLAGWRSTRSGGSGRLDAARAGYLMWGLWLVVHAVGFSTGYVVHTFYVIAMAPAVAALAAAGMVELGRRYLSGAGRRLVPAAVITQAVWAILLCVRFYWFQPWLGPLVGLSLGAGLVLLLLARRRLRDQHSADPDRRPADHLPFVRLATFGAVLAVGGAVLGPATWAVSTVDPAYAGSAVGPWAGPSGGGPGGRIVRSAANTRDPGPISTVPTPRTRALIGYLAAHRRGEKYLAAAGDSTGAEALVMAGADVLPLGGWSGAVPFPTVEGFAKLVADGQVRYVLVDGPGLRGPNALFVLPTDPWVTGHCAPVDEKLYGGPGDQSLYDCRP